MKKTVKIELSFEELAEVLGERFGLVRKPMTFYVSTDDNIITFEAEAVSETSPIKYRERE